MTYPAEPDSGRCPVVRETVAPGRADPPQPRLLDRVRAAIRSHHYSRRTEKAYVH